PRAVRTRPAARGRRPSPGGLDPVGMVPPIVRPAPRTARIVDRWDPGGGLTTHRRTLLGRHIPRSTSRPRAAPPVRRGARPGRRRPRPAPPAGRRPPRRPRPRRLGRRLRRPHRGRAGRAAPARRRRRAAAPRPALARAGSAAACGDRPEAARDEPPPPSGRVEGATLRFDEPVSTVTDLLAPTGEGEPWTIVGSVFDPDR